MSPVTTLTHMIFPSQKLIIYRWRIKQKLSLLPKLIPTIVLRQLQSMGFAELTRKDVLARWKKDVLSRGNRHDKLTMINSEIFERFKDTRNNKEQVQINHNISQ
jgi:hypothetical protein